MPSWKRIVKIIVMHLVGEIIVLQRTAASPKTKSWATVCNTGSTSKDFKIER